MFQNHFPVIASALGVLCLLWSFYSVYGKKLTSYQSHAKAVTNGCIGIAVGIGLLVIAGIIYLI